MNKYEDMWKRLRSTLRCVYVASKLIPGLLPPDPDGVGEATLKTTLHIMEKMEEDFDV